MKKLLKVILPIILISSMCITVFASESNVITGEHTDCDSHEHFEVIFDENTPFTAEQQEQIIAALENPDSQISTYGFTCWLLGHNYEYDTVSTITHCVSSTQPRCLKEMFKIGLCSRCGETTTEKIGEQYIYCCP